MAHWWLTVGSLMAHCWLTHGSLVAHCWLIGGSAMVLWCDGAKYMQHIPPWMPRCWFVPSKDYFIAKICCGTVSTESFF
jgi:hypothetical protein